MKRNTFIFFGLIIIFFSCKNEDKELLVTQNESEINKSIENFISKNNKIQLSGEAKKIVNQWQEYQNVAEFIPKFYKINTEEALFNSQHLAILTQQLKDSIRIKKFNKPSFRIRLNVLHNEAMRLADMDSINSITNREIIVENKNIINAFEAIKTKINSMVKKEILESDLDEFDYLFRIDSVDNKDLTIPKLKKPRTIQPLNNTNNE
jgi:hypothetical protein